MASRKEKLTKTLVESLKAGDIIWDSETSGFGIRCQKKGTFYFLKKRIGGVQKWLTIGEHGAPYGDKGQALTVTKARDRADILTGEIKSGKDPSLEREELKNLKTIKHLMDSYLNDYAIGKKKASSIRVDKASIENHILPLLGKKNIVDVTDLDIERFKRAVKAGKTGNIKKGAKAIQGGPVIANRCLALLSKAFNLSVRWKLRADNPVKFIDRYDEEKRDRYLSEKEFAALFEALAKEEGEGGNSFAVAAIRLLVMTGARHSEILTLKWTDVDFENGRLNLPDSKTGKKSIFLSPPAKGILSSLDREKDNPFVICGAIENTHLVNIRKTWRRVKEKATLQLWEQDPAIKESIDRHYVKRKKLTFKALNKLLSSEFMELGDGLLDVRIHDLRHSFASVAAASGMSLHMIGKLLGHSNAATTARYAHLADDPVQQANDAVGRKIQSLIYSKQEDNIRD